MVLDAEEMARNGLDSVNRPFSQYERDRVELVGYRLSLPEILHIISHGSTYQTNDKSDEETR